MRRSLMLLQCVLCLALAIAVLAASPASARQPLPYEGRWAFRDHPSGTRGVMILKARSAVSGSERCIFHRVRQRGQTYLIDETCDGERLSSSIRVDGPNRLSIRYRVLSSGEIGTRVLRRLSR